MAAVLITGCSSGIGLETALAFARRGDHTYASMRNPEKAARLRERAAAENLEVEVLALDVTDDASVAAAVQLVEERHGAVDVLVNNAGITYAGAIEVTPIEQARAVMETNFWGVLRTIRAALPAMRARGGGVIVNVSSLAGRVWSVPYGGFYSASKAGIGSLSEALAGEVEQFGVRVVCIEPGSFATDVQTNAFNRELSEEDPYSADEAWLTRFMVRIAEAGGSPPWSRTPSSPPSRTLTRHCTRWSARRPRWRWTLRARPDMSSGIRSSSSRPSTSRALARSSRSSPPSLGELS